MISNSELYSIREIQNAVNKYRAGSKSVAVTYDRVETEEIIWFCIKTGIQNVVNQNFQKSLKQVNLFKTLNENQGETKVSTMLSTSEFKAALDLTALFSVESNVAIDENSLFRFVIYRSLAELKAEPFNKIAEKLLCQSAI